VPSDLGDTLAAYLGIAVVIHQRTADYKTVAVGFGRQSAQNLK
jgi:hypothetical protein